MNEKIMSWIKYDPWVLAQRMICFGVLALIAVAAHPWGPWERAAHGAWRSLAFFQLDVSMTPFTPDMAMMEGAQLYGSHVQLFWRDRSETRHDISWRDVPFHSFRVPLLLGVEQRLAGRPTPGYDFALCRSMETTMGFEPFSFGGTIRPKFSPKEIVLWEETPCPPKN